MALRLPTHLDSIIPPPAEQVRQRRPWQWTLTLTFMNTTQGMYQDVFAKVPGATLFSIVRHRTLGNYLNSSRTSMQVNP